MAVSTLGCLKRDAASLRLLFLQGPTFTHGTVREASFPLLPLQNRNLIRQVQPVSVRLLPGLLAPSEPPYSLLLHSNVFAVSPPLWIPHIIQLAQDLGIETVWNYVSVSLEFSPGDGWAHTWASQLTAQTLQIYQWPPISLRNCVW